MNWLRNMMAGRYGPDQLGISLIVLSFLLTFVSQLLRAPWLALVSYIPLILCLFRMFSKNLSKRSMENYRFSILFSPVYKGFQKRLKHMRYRKTHRLFRCPNCKVLLAHPKGQGKITITCPKCRTSFERKT